MKWHEVAQVRRISECCRDGDGTVFKLSFIILTIALQMVREHKSELFCVMFMREHCLRDVLIMQQNVSQIHSFQILHNATFHEHALSINCNKSRSVI
jgi:hypothetical protein